MTDQVFNFIHIIIFFLCTIAIQINRIYISKINSNKTGIIIYSILSVTLIVLMIIIVITIK